MFNSLLARVLSAPDSPTADLYFGNACADFVERGVTRLAPTVFASRTACLVMRHDLRAGRLPDRRRLIYFLDDDVDAGVTDQSLPYFYRQKLRLVERGAGRRISRFAGVAVVGSERLANLFRPSMDTHLLRPYWSEKFAGLGHFDALEAGEGWIDVAYLGSVVHRSDLQFTLPFIAHLLAVEPRLRFHVPERHTLPAAFDRHPRVCRIKGLGWTAYRRELTGRQFHIALYPLLDTPFNRARSPNKLIEHAVVGAAPIYSRTWSEAHHVQDGRDGVLLANKTGDWKNAIEALIRDPGRLRRIATGAQTLAARLNDPRPQRSLWQRLLDLNDARLS